MAVKMTEAQRWLADLLKASGSTGFQFPKYALISPHAYQCGCRLLSEAKIVQLMTSTRGSPKIGMNTNPSRKPNSYKIFVTDYDVNIPDNRRKVELVVLFVEGWQDPTTLRVLTIPIVIHGWRENSPYPENDRAPPCVFDVANPPCRPSSGKGRPRGRI